MKRIEASKITCIADVRISERIEAEVDRMGLLETYSERGKQVALKARSAWLPFARRSTMLESPAEVFRFYVPREYERAAMVRLAGAADLFLPGRGSVCAQDVVLMGEDLHFWEDSNLCSEPPDWVLESRLQTAPYDMIFCIVQRGRGEELARTILDMGLGVPVISYGEGMGLRDRLGLLRITIPQEKELFRFLVPSNDSDLVVDVAVRTAGLNQAGQGFLSRTPVRALAVNTQMNLDRRRHVASMEQVISTLDQLRGSTDWRRISAAARRHHAARPPEHGGMVRFSLVCESGTGGPAVQAAMEAGASGATLSRLSRRMKKTLDSPGLEEAALASCARECCELIVTRAVALRLEEAVIKSGLFEKPANGFIEIASVQDAVTYAGS